jgi:hypothetical protein
MGDLLDHALRGVDLNSPTAAWQIFRNLMALVPWWQLLLWNVAFALVGLALGYWRGRPWEGLVWGALLGPLGWLALLARPSARRGPPG